MHGDFKKSIEDIAKREMFICKEEKERSSILNEINKAAKMGDFVNLFSGHLSRKQTRTYIDKLVQCGMLSYNGEGKMRTYSLSKRYENEIAVITKVVKISLDEMFKQAWRHQ